MQNVIPIYMEWMVDQTEARKTTETFNVYAITTIYTVGIIIDLFTVVLFLTLSFCIDPMVAVVLLLSILASFALSFHSGKQRLLDFERFENAKEADTIINHETVEDYLRIISHTDITEERIAELREKVHLSAEIDRIADNGAHLSGENRD